MNIRTRQRKIISGQSILILILLALLLGVQTGILWQAGKPDPAPITPPAVKVILNVPSAQWEAILGRISELENVVMNYASDAQTN